MELVSLAPTYLNRALLRLSLEAEVKLAASDRLPASLSALHVNTSERTQTETPGQTSARAVQLEKKNSMRLVRFLSFDGTRTIAVNPRYVVSVRDSGRRGKVETVIRTIVSCEMVGEKLDTVVVKLYPEGVDA